MRQSKKHLFKKWEVSIIKFKNSIGNIFKVTRKIPNSSVSETKMFRRKKSAKRQFEDWLR